MVILIEEAGKENFFYHLIRTIRGYYEKKSFLFSF